MDSHEEKVISVPNESVQGPPEQSSDWGRAAADVMNRSVHTCSKFSTVTEAVVIFKSEDCGMVPIVEDGKPIGVLTDRDVALSLANQPDLTERPVSDIMTTDLVTVKIDTPVTEVAQLMAQQQIRRVLVVDSNGMLVGVISWSDIAPYLPVEQTGEMVAEVVEKT